MQLLDLCQKTSELRCKGGEERHEMVAMDQVS